MTIDPKRLRRAIDGMEARLNASSDTTPYGHGIVIAAAKICLRALEGQRTQRHGADPLLRTKEVAVELDIHPVTLYRMRREGKFPPAIRIGPRMVGWRRSVIEQWKNDRPAATVGE